MRLVLLPGFDGSGDLFSPLLNNLSTDIKPLVLSYPNDKLMTYEEIFNYLAPKFPQEPCCILGESFGGPLSILFAQRKKEYVKGIILCVTFASNPRPELCKYLRPFIHPVLFRKKIPYWYVKIVLLSGNNDAKLIRQVQGANARLSADIIYKRLEEIAEINVTESLKSLDIPILYQRATKDRLVKKYSLDQIEKNTLRLTVSSFEAPHLLLQTKPNETARDIENFIINLYSTKVSV